MDCSCHIDSYTDDCERVELYKSKIVMARKPHICGECKRLISKEKYEYASYLYEGKFWQEKICIDCRSARIQFYPGGSWAFGNLWNDIEIFIGEVNGEIPESCISELTPKARDRVCDLIERVRREK